MSAVETWFVNAVIVETRTGGGAYGAKYAPPRTVPCWISDAVKQVRNSHGEEVVSMTTLFAAPHEASSFAVGSRVTMASRTADVLSVAVNDSGSLQLGIDHIVVHLT